MKKLLFGKQSSACIRCCRVFHTAALSKNRCPECEQKRLELVDKTNQMANNNAIAQASRQFMVALKNMGSDAAALPKLTDAFLEKIGGAESLAQMLVEDFNAVRGVGLEGEAALEFARKDSVIQKYHQMIQLMLMKNDERKTIDASGLTDDDLIATIGTIVPELMKGDAQYRERLVMEAIANDPDLRKKIIEINGGVVLDAKEPEKPEEPVAIEAQPKSDISDLDYSEAGSFLSTDEDDE